MDVAIDDGHDNPAFRIVLGQRKHSDFGCHTASLPTRGISACPAGYAGNEEVRRPTKLSCYSLRRRSAIPPLACGSLRNDSQVAPLRSRCANRPSCVGGQPRPAGRVDPTFAFRDPRVGARLRNPTNGEIMRGWTLIGTPGSRYRPSGSAGGREPSPSPAEGANIGKNLSREFDHRRDVLFPVTVTDEVKPAPAQQHAPLRHFLQQKPQASAATSDASPSNASPSSGRSRRPTR